MSISESNASVGKRFLNNLLDIAGYLAFAFVSGILIAIFQMITGVEILTKIEGLFGQVFGIILILVYFVLFEGVTGKSPAKFITRTRILNEDGNRPGLNTILTRSLVRLIPFEGLAVLGDEGRTLHDKWSGTYVVDEKLFAQLLEIES